HRRAALHLLRHVRRGMPGRRDRADRAVRPVGPVARGDDLRQGQAPVGLRPDQEHRANEGPQPLGAHRTPEARGEDDGHSHPARSGSNPVNALATRDLALAIAVVVLGAAGTYLLLPHSHGAAKPRHVHAAGGALVALAILLLLLFWTPPASFLLSN